MHNFVMSPSSVICSHFYKAHSKVTVDQYGIVIHITVYMTLTAECLTVSHMLCINYNQIKSVN